MNSILTRDVRYPDEKLEVSNRRSVLKLDVLSGQNTGN